MADRSALTWQGAWQSAFRPRSTGSAANLAACVAVLTVSLVVSGCATLDSTFRALQSGTSRPGAAERPELGVEYDVLLAELSMGDGDYLAASQALVRAVADRWRYIIKAANRPPIKRWQYLGMRAAQKYDRAFDKWIAR